MTDTAADARGFFYSATTGGFYHSDVHAAPPADAIAVSDARHAELMAAQAAGVAIVAGPDGTPVERLPDEPSDDELRARAIAAVKREAQRRILAAAPLWRQLNDLVEPTADGAKRAAETVRLRDRSNAIEADVAVLDAAKLAAFDPAPDALWA